MKRFYSKMEAARRAKAKPKAKPGAYAKKPGMYKKPWNLTVDVEVRGTFEARLRGGSIKVYINHYVLK